MKYDFFELAESQGFMRISQLGSARRVLIFPQDNEVIRFYSPEFRADMETVHASGTLGLAIPTQADKFPQNKPIRMKSAEFIAWHLLNIDRFRRSISSDVSIPEAGEIFLSAIKSLLDELPSTMKSLLEFSRDSRSWIGQQLLSWHDPRVQSFRARLAELQFRGSADTIPN